MTIEYIVTKDQRRMAAGQEFAPDDEGLCQTLRAWLHGVLKVHSPVAAVAEKLPEARRVIGRRYDQNLPYPRQHQRAERVVDHRLVIDGQQLFRNCLGDRVKPRSRPPSKDDALTQNWRAHRSGARSSRDMHRL